MKKIPILLIIASLISCKDKSDKLDNVEKTDSVVSRSIPKAETIKDSPTRSFLVLVKILDSLGYSSDTVRVKQVKNYQELRDIKIVLFDEFPFYRINEENTKVLWWNSITRDKGDSIDVEVFNQAISVWGYFYAKRESSSLTIDGVIEQWKFMDKGTAQIALDKLKARYPLPYFNTEPYYLIEEQFLFIFHTRASAFSYKQKEFFNKFIEISSAP